MGGVGRAHLHLPAPGHLAHRPTTARHRSALDAGLHRRVPARCGTSERTGTFIDFYPDLRVAWDSGYYLSIATRGYEDLAMTDVQGPEGRRLTNNYAFLPLYPLLIHCLTPVMRLTGLADLAAPVYAALVVSLLGALVAIISLSDLVDRAPGATEGDGLRAAFYLLIFPTGFFLAQVYTEGLFTGLAFGSLALARRHHWLAATILAGLATLTRATGVLLAIPLAIEILLMLRTQRDEGSITLRAVATVLPPLLPIGVFVAWRLSEHGQAFAYVEEHVFGRQALALGASWDAWRDVVIGLGHVASATRAYYALELAALALALVTCLAALRRDLPLALFGLAVLATSVLSGMPQSMIRYMIAVPPIFLILARMGRYEAFDRVWTIGSMLLLGLLLTLFSFDMWVA